MEFRHDASEIPSAPVVDVVVSNPDGGSSREKGLIDTGASITGIPERLVDELGLSKDATMWITGAFGAEPRNRYSVRLAIGGTEFGTISAVATAPDRILIGRDMINLWTLTLDGKNEVFRIEAWSNDPGDISTWPRRAGP